MKTSTGYGINYNLSATQSQGNSACLAEINNTSEKVIVSDTSINLTYTRVERGATMNNCSMTYLWYYDAPTYIGVARHNGGANYTFCDGHAKYLKKADWIYKMFSDTTFYDQHYKRD